MRSESIDVRPPLLGWWRRLPCRLLWCFHGDANLLSKRRTEQLLQVLALSERRIGSSVQTCLQRRQLGSTRGSGAARSVIEHDVVGTIGLELTGEALGQAATACLLVR